VAEVAKELGDVFIKLCDVANVFGWTFEKCIKSAGLLVSQRNFTKDKIGHGIDSD
jgi:hypothetical protein